MARKVIGREEELASVRAFVDRAQEGEGPVALVLEGEAGIGKSTLWLAGVEHACGRGMHVLSSRPTEAERGLAHVGLGDLLDSVLDDVASELSPPRRRALEAALLREETGDSVDRRALAVAVQDALQLLSRRQLLVVGIDDVQWLDPSSSSALAFAMRRPATSRVLVLLARRHVDSAEPSELEHALGAERVERLLVGPLSVGALHSLLRDHLDRVFARQTLLRIHEHSGGNPFFALELARALGSEVDPTQPLPVPQTLEGLVRARLVGLPATTRDALALAAALGAPSQSLLGRAGVDSHALDAAVEAQLIEREDGGLRFTHPLLSSVLYADLADRQSVHRRIAEVVEGPLVRARHLALATEAADGEVAAVLDEAVRTAADCGAAAVAAELAEHALRLTPGDAREELRRRALVAARMHRVAGEWTRARMIANDLLAETEPGPFRAEILSLLAGFESRERAAALLEEALGDASASPALRSTIHCSLSWATRFRDGLGAAFEHAQMALALADEADDDALRVDALKLLTINGSMLGDPDAPLHAARAHELATALGDERVLKEATLALAAALGNDHADFDSTRELLEREYREWRERDEPFAAELLFYLAWIRVLERPVGARGRVCGASTRDQGPVRARADAPTRRPDRVDRRPPWRTRARA
jgi:AAA ATPase domain